VLALANMLCMAQSAFAAIPAAINYQGRLTNSAGVPQQGGKTMSLKILDSSTEGTLLYSENLGNVTIDANGVYGFQFGAIGAGTPPNLTTALAASTEQWLELTVNGEPQAPRQKILAVPYALMAGALPDGAVSSAMIADGAVGLSKITGLGSAATVDIENIVTNAAVNAAIAESPGPMRESLGLGKAATTSAKTINRVVSLGTSISNSSSKSVAGQNAIETLSSGWLVVAQTKLEHRFRLARRATSEVNVNQPKIAFGYDGYTSASLLNSYAPYPTDFPMAEAIETHADAIVIEAGANDTGLGAAGAAAAVVTLWDRAIPHFNTVFALNVLPQGPANGDRRPAITGCNALLATAAASRPKVVLIDVYSAVETDANGYATTTHFSTDLVHPNAAGGYAMGAAVAAAMEPYVNGPKYKIPENGSGQWITTNQLKVGAATLPVGWSASVVGSGHSYAAVDEYSTGGYRWQRFSGTPGGSPALLQPYQVIYPQTEVLWANAAAVGAGTGTITVTARCLGKTVSVPFVVGAADPVNTWAASARAAIAADAELMRHFTQSNPVGAFIDLRVKIPDRNDPTFAITAQLPGLAVGQKAQRWTQVPYSAGGWRYGDRIRATGRFRVVSGKVVSIGVAASCYTAGGTHVAGALGYTSGISGPISGTDGLYLTEDFEIPEDALELMLRLRIYGSGNCVIDARDVGAFLETR
jgi:hypothetical protein